MDSIQFLRGHQLDLRPLEEADLPRCQRWINDPEVRRTTTLAFPMDARAERAWWEGQPRGGAPHTINLAIVLKDSGEHIGNTGLMGINWIDRRGTSGTILDPAHWRRGYATEAKWLLLKYAFLELGLRRVESVVIAFNEASARHLKANGFTQEGLRPQAFFREGAFHDEQLFGVTPEAFKASRAWARYEAP
ncbi:GNAT family N-acetyltransferase [Myxococcota bacterium]|nr:GNAT family N-acetyltransferase [Myxococcota bacterium]MBU1430209.1 GNAT family N-acetyltransferase [Myxococcota bacterium]MBU1897915.1 GNAT family N-acetyltransferase [Myxococcota bacterium]